MSGASVINVRASLPEDTRDCCSFFAPLGTYIDYLTTGNQAPLDQHVATLAGADGRDPSEFRYYSGSIDLDRLDAACGAPIDVSVLPHFGPGERGPDPVIQYWLGRKGSSIGLHRDGFFGYLVHLRGRKEVTLLAPDQRRFLSLEHWGGIYSPVDVYDETFEEHPRFRHATWERLVLYPGDALLIPKWWFHNVRALDDDATSVNIWFSADDVVMPGQW